jgi:hypothetical protein
MPMQPSRTTLARPAWATAVAWVCLPVAALAAPAIDRIQPPGGPRGAEVEVEFRGRDLGEPQELFFEESPIVVANLTGVDAGKVKATLKIPADCPLGPQRLRLRTSDGLSELRTFRVGGYEQTPEAEPNNDFPAAQAVAMPRTISGVVQGEDVDCFKVHLAAGARIAAAIDGIRLDQEMFDPHLELVDAKGFVVAACDDHPLLGQDGMLAAVVPADGDYVLRVRESAFGGNDGCVYLLHVGDFPVPHLAWPPVGKPAATFAVEWLGDPAGPFAGQVTLPGAAGPAGVIEIQPERAAAASPVPVPFRMSPLNVTAEAEPNDDPGKATKAAAPAGFLARMDAAEDVDWFRVEAPKGTHWNVRGWGRRLGSPIDLVVNAHRDDEKRERLTGNDDTDGPDSTLRVTVPDQGAFLLRVNDHLRRGGPQFVYWLEVEPAVPLVTVSVPPARGNSQERLVAEVPRGNRTALLFNTSRSDFSGPVNLEFAGLPAGVNATAATAPGNAPATLAVFDAPAEAVPAAACATVAVKAADDGRQIGCLRQTTELVLGQPNNATYRASVSERLPVAVIDEAPVRIEVEPPAVPLVRRGVIDLKVRIERLDGFDGKVKLAFPFKPPGIGAAANVEVPEGQSEAVYQLNAAADAAIADWQVAVLATALMKNDPQADGGKDGKKKRKRREGETTWVSSRLVPLKVAEPLIELAAEKAVVEQGQETKIVWAVKKPATFTGMAKAKLLGLPSGTEAPELDLAADATELVFPVKAGSDAPPGQHSNVFCQLRVPQADAWVIHNMPPTHLRIDKPLPTSPPQEAKP